MKIAFISSFYHPDTIGGAEIVVQNLSESFKKMNYEVRVFTLGKESCVEQVNNINLDITDSGQLFNALSGYANIPELKSGEVLKSFKAVVHLAAIPRILVKPDNEIFRINTLGTYNVIEAATKLGIKNFFRDPFPN